MGMKEKIIVNGMTKWGGEFVDKVSGEKIVGTPYTKLFFTSKFETVSENKKGLFEAEYKGELGLFDKLKNLIFPQELEIDITMRPDGKGLAMPWVTDANPVVIDKKAS